MQTSHLESASLLTPNRRLGVLEFLAWLAGVLLLLLLHSLILRTLLPVNTSYAVTNTSIGALTLLLGIRVFIGHGGRRITALGLFSLASALFVGYSGIHHSLRYQAHVAPTYITTSLAGASLTLLLVAALFWRTDSHDPRLERQTASPRDADWALITGGIVLLALALLVAADPSFRVLLVEGAAFASILLIAVGVVYSERTRRLASAPLVAVLLLPIAYTIHFHAGGGRLRVVALMCSVLLLVSARFPSKTFKYLIVTAVPVALLALAFDRLALQEAFSPGSSFGRTGLESMTSPLLLFARVIQNQVEAGANLAWGRTLVTVPLSLLPEWVGMPRPTALGYELVALVDASRINSGYSVAATFFGEWVYNFSLVGLLALVPVLGWSLTRLDHWMLIRLQKIRVNRTFMIRALIAAMVCGAVGDLAWSGIHTYGMRTISRLPVPLVLLALTWVGAQLSQRRSEGRPGPSQLQDSSPGTESGADSSCDGILQAQITGSKNG